MDQPRLFEFRMGDRSPDKLVVAEANRDAAKLPPIGAAGRWRTGARRSPGSGKTRTACRSKAHKFGFTVAEDAAAIFSEANGRLLIDDADHARHVLVGPGPNRHGAVLIVGTTTLQPGPSVLIYVRGSHLPVANLRRICREQFIQLSDDAAALRLPRTLLKIAPGGG